VNAAAPPLPYFDPHARLERIMAYVLGQFYPPNTDPDNITINPWHESYELTKAQPSPAAWKPARGGVIIVEHIEATHALSDSGDARSDLALSIRYDGSAGAYLVGSDNAGLNLSLVPDPENGISARPLYVPAWLTSQRGIVFNLSGTTGLASASASVQVGLHGWICLGAQGV